MTLSRIHQLPSPAADASHCLAPFWGGGKTEGAPGNPLIYRHSDGPWFERLCYRLGWREGYTMRYFGRLGQEQYGADLVGTSSGKTVVWQCKNLQTPPKQQDMTKWIKHFRNKWLVEQQLPAPVCFVLCCSQPMKDVVTDAAWQRLASDMQEKWNVAIELWDRDAIDEMLRSSPDIVADLFGDTSAEFFFGGDIWQATPLLRPISFSNTPNTYPHRISRYGLSIEEDRIYVQDDRQDCLAALSENHPIAVVRGAPGSGKTYDALTYCRQRANEGWRTYYLNLGDLGASGSNHQIADDIRRRLSLPTLFILDDCHGHEIRVADIIDRLAGSRDHHNLRILCLCRHVQLDQEMEREGSQSWHESLEANGAVLDVKQDDAYLKGYVEFLRPDFRGLSQNRWQRLCSLTGRNLLLLNFYLNIGTPPEDLDRENQQRFYDSFRKHGLGGDTQNKDALQRLAAIAQFELAPPAEWVGGNSTEIAAQTPGFLVQAGWPRRLHFVHSSAAELVFHSLTTPASGLATQLGNLLQNYLTSRITEAGEDPDQRADCLDEAAQILAIRPVLIAPAALSAVHCRWLKTAAIATPLLEWSRDIGGHPLASRALLTLTTADDVNESASQPYADSLILWLRKYLNTSQTIPPEKNHLFRPSVINLALNAPSMWVALEESTPPASWLQAIKARSALPELFNLIQYASPSFARHILNHLTRKDLDELIDKTRSSGCSIGTLNSAFRETGKNAPDLLTTLEAKCDPQRWLELIAANGTIVELFKLLQNSSPEFARRLLNALSQEVLNQLIDKTRSSGCSIGTLNLALRELGKNAPELLADLETKCDPQRWLELIAANGTIFELFKLLENSSPDFTRRLLNALSQEVLNQLFDKTRSSGRSIGTLNLSLRELGKNAPELLADLEAKFDPQRWLELIAANGTIVELFKLLENSPPDFARRLLNALSQEVLNQLIDKTRSSGCSIGTLDLSLRELGKNAPELLATLETKCDPQCWLELIAANGTIFELFRLLQNSSPDFARRLLNALTPEYLDKLIDKTHSSDCSIGTLNIALRILGKKTPELRSKLQDRVGVRGFSALIFGSGTLGNFADLGEDFSDDFRPLMLAYCATRPDVEWNSLAHRSTFFELAEFLARSHQWMAQWPEGKAQVATLAAHAPTLARQASWYALYTGQQQASSLSSCAWHTQLLTAVKTRVEKCTEANLPEPDDLCELANAAPLLLNARPDLANEMATRIGKALSNVERQAGEDYARWTPQLIFQLRHTAFSERTVDGCLKAVLAEPTVSILMEQGNHVQRFLWLWNTLAIHWERFSPGKHPEQASREFRKYRDEAFWQQLVANWVAHATQLRKFSDIEPVLCSAGIFALLGLKLPPQNRLTWNNLRTLRFNLSKALENPKRGFVPSWFLQFGARAVLRDRNAFSEERRITMMQKLARYEQATPAVAALATAMDKYAAPTRDCWPIGHEDKRRPYGSNNHRS